jgi:hypothetical protein
MSLKTYTALDESIKQTNAIKVFFQSSRFKKWYEKNIGERTNRFLTH